MTMSKVEAAALLAVLLLTVTGTVIVLWCLRKNIASYIRARLESGTARLKLIAAKHLDAAGMLNETRPARKAAQVAKLAAQDASSRATAEAAASAADALKQLVIDSQAAIIKAETDAKVCSAKRLAYKDHPWLRLSDRVRRLFKDWDPFPQLAVCAVMAAALIWSLAFTIDKAQTSNHLLRLVTICKVYTNTEGRGDPAGAISTTAGNFLLDPMQVGNRVYPTSVTAKAAFRKGYIVDLTWHGRIVNSPFVTRVVYRGSGSCNGVGTITGKATAQAQVGQLAGRGRE
jgi:hypothetical protein